MELRNAYQNQKINELKLSALLEGLLEAGIEVYTCRWSCLAAVVQGAPITTMDADIVYGRSFDNIAKIMASFIFQFTIF